MIRPYVLAIDPGTKASGVCLVRRDDLKPLLHEKIENSELVQKMTDALLPYMSDHIQLVIERMHNPMSADSNVFLTCEWIGRFDVALQQVFKGETAYLFRYQEYKNLCANIYSRNDKGIKSALVDRFAYGVRNYGKGTKDAPGWFYGFSADVWSAYAIAVTYIDMALAKEITVF